MVHDPASFARSVDELALLCREQGRSPTGLQRTALVARPSPSDVQAWDGAGATRLIVAPWNRSSEAVDGLEAFAAQQQLRGPT